MECCMQVAAAVDGMTSRHHAVLKFISSDLPPSPTHAHCFYLLVNVSLLWRAVSRFSHQPASKHCSEGKVGGCRVAESRKHHWLLQPASF